MFVEHVERGDTTSPELRKAAAGYLAPLEDEGVDTLILGCTHYPLLSGLLQLELGPDVVLVSSAEETAKDVYAELLRGDALRTARRAARTTSSRRPATPARSAISPSVFLGLEVARVDAVHVESGRRRVRLTVLGSQGTWPGASRECCGYLVTADGFNLWLDAGTGTFARLQEHLPVGELGGLLISHGHADHFLDIIPAFYARHYGGLGAPGLPFHSPPGFTDLAALLVSEAGRNVMARGLRLHARDARRDLRGRAVPRHAVRDDPHRRALARVPDRGRRQGARLHRRHRAVRRGDRRWRSDADLFLCEATYQNDSELSFFHLSALQAAEHAAAGGAARLVLTHITPNLDPGVSLERGGGRVRRARSTSRCPTW